MYADRPDSTEVNDSLDTLTDTIVSCACKVRSTLGTGLVTSTYENALAHELRSAGLRVLQILDVLPVGGEALVGDDETRLLVEDSVLVELASVPVLQYEHLSRCRDRLRVTGLDTCLVVNFGAPEERVPN